MDVSTISLLLALGAIGITVAVVILMASRKKKAAWMPTPDSMADQDLPARLLSAEMLVEEASNWFAAAKQETDELEAIVRASYGISCLRVLQSRLRLEEIQSSALPSNIQSPDELMKRLSTMQNKLAEQLRTARTPPEQSVERELRSRMFQQPRFVTRAVRSAHTSK